MSPKATRQLPPIPPAFAIKKAAIIASLAVPSAEYKDSSPKGSVDEGIRSLLDKINTLDGVVTTSSCAGRVSVFLEGRKSQNRFDDGEVADDDREPGSRSEQVVVSGGKGNGGRWLFVSHEPVDVRRALDAQDNVMGFLGMADGKQQASNDIGNNLNLTNSGTRLVRFQFEPMILHIMTASLAHASSVLTAAINSGFRESGVQSLKNLDDPLHAFPMVAVRTSGLSLASVIGYVEEDETSCDETEESIRCLVSEGYLVLLLRLACERFQANEQRKERFENELFKSVDTKSVEWESSQSRQARKRADGLARRHQLRAATGGHVENAHDEDYNGDVGLPQD